MLERLAYVLECGVLDYTGELKFELGRLCEQVEQVTDADVPLRDTVLGELHDSLEFYMARDEGAAASALSRASRTWWEAVIARLPTMRGADDDP